MTRRAMNRAVPNIEGIVVSAKRRFLTRLLFAIPLIAVGACAQPAPAPNASVPRAVTEWLNQDRGTIGVVALGPDQMMGDHWFEFDQGAKAWFAEAPTMMTRKRRPPPDFKAELPDQYEAYMLDLAPTAANPGVYMAGLALAPLMISLKTMIVSTTPGQIYETTRPLPEIMGVNSPAIATLDKKRVAEAVRDQVVQVAAYVPNLDVRGLPFEDIAGGAWPTNGDDTTLTVRVVGIGLWADRTINSDPALRIKIWTYFDRTTFLPFEYKSHGRPLDDWARDDARLLREELYMAARELARQIVTRLFIARRD